MPSLDIVSKVEMQEIDNTVNSVIREIANRYDFKGSNCSLEFDKEKIIINADDDYKLSTIQDLLKMFSSRRKIDSKVFDFQTPEKATGNSLRQIVNIKQGIDSDNAKKIMKLIKEEKFKVTVSNKGDKIKLDSNKIDELRAVMSFLNTKNFDIAINFENFK